MAADQRTVSTLWSLERVGLRCEGLYDERQSEGLMIILEQSIVCQCQSLLVIQCLCSRLDGVRLIVVVTAAGRCYA